MMIAIIIFTCLLSFQFVASIDRKCSGLSVMFALEIILFAFIMNGGVLNENVSFWISCLLSSVLLVHFLRRRV